MDKAKLSQLSYSFSYTAAPPDGRRLEALFVDKVAEACSMFSAGNKPSDFDAIKVSLAGSELGTYNIGSDDAPGSSYVEWIRMRNGVVEGKAFSTSGRINYIAGPTSEDDWRNIRNIRMDVVVKYEVDPVVKSECSFAIFKKSGEKFGSCTCQRLSGMVFSCDTTTVECCHDSVGEMQEYQFKVAGTACPQQCTSTTGLLPYCYNLL